MILKSAFFFLMLLLCGGMCFAQTTRDVNPINPPKPAYQASKKEEKSFLFFKKKKKDNSTDIEVQEFRERMQKVQKQKRKEAKLAEKPQYSDPLYFGHKRPPKKRKNGKKKFCKECGLSH